MTNQIQQKTAAEALAIQKNTKAPIGLVPPSSILAMARVFEFGALKYQPNNWKAMMANGKQVQFIEAIIRHALKMLDGEMLDAESLQTHAAHIMTNAAMLHYQTTTPAEEIAKFKDMDLLIKEGVDEKKTAKTLRFKVGDRLWTKGYGPSEHYEEATVIPKRHPSSPFGYLVQYADGNDACRFETEVFAENPQGKTTTTPAEPKSVKPLKVGDKIWTLEYGPGKIYVQATINQVKLHGYPLDVTFVDGNTALRDHHEVFVEKPQ